MLSDEVIEKVVERLIVRIDKANDYILKKIGGTIKDFGSMTQSERKQLIQMIKYGGDFDKIVKKLAEITELNVYDIYEIFEEVAKSDYRFAKQFYKYRNKKYIPYNENKLLQQQVRAIASITAKEYLNITRTNALGFGFVDSNGNVTFKGLKKAYVDLLDEAILSVSQGKETFDSAMYRQLKNIGESGLKVVYNSGRAVRLDTAVRTCIKEGITNMHTEIQKQIGEEFGSDGVELSVHGHPAPDHEEAQGKQFSTDEFEKLQETGVATTYDKVHIDMIRYNSFRPIGKLNCYHYPFSIILGVNKQQYSNKELQKIRDDNNKGFDYKGKHYTMYQGTQLQRKLETAIREQKDANVLGKYGNNQELIDKSRKRLNALNKRYKEVCDVSGLPIKANRLRVSGYRKSRV